MLFLASGGCPHQIQLMLLNQLSAGVISEQTVPTLGTSLSAAT